MEIEVKGNYVLLWALEVLRRTYLICMGFVELLAQWFVFFFLLTEE